MSNTSTIYVYLIHYKVVKLIKGDFIMGIAYHKKTSTKYVQYTLRIEESILDKIKSIAGKEDLSVYYSWKLIHFINTFDPEQRFAFIVLNWYVVKYLIYVNTWYINAF